MFNNKFKIKSEDISKSIKKDGYFVFEGAVSKKFISSILKDVKDSGISLNKNGIGYSIYDTQLYLTNILAVSKTFFDYCTSKYFFKIFDSYFNKRYRLKAFRYYETYNFHKMKWHSDNKSDETKHNKRGLIVITYLTDVYNGEFQFIKGSHKWSHKIKNSNYEDDQIEKDYKSKIISFKKPKGTIIIYNTFGIHRAKLFKDKNFVRKSLFFQVDCNNNSEPIILKTSFLKSKNKKILEYLGFGLKSDYISYPQTNMRSLPLNKNTFLIFSKWFIFQFFKKTKNIFKNFLLY